MDLRSGNPFRPWSVTENPVIRGYTDVAPPPFLQTCSEIGKERDEFSPIKGNKTPKGSMSQFFLFFFLDYILIYYTQLKVSTLYTLSHMYTSPHFWACLSADQRARSIGSQSA